MNESDKMSDKPKEIRWYVLRAIGGQEKKVKEYIESETARRNLQESIIRALIPCEKVFQVRNGKKVSKERILFSGYVFVECLLTAEVAQVLRDIPGVLGFLSETKNGTPMPLTALEVNRMLGTVDEQVGEEIIDSPYCVGETVKVVDGPFNSFVGVIEEVNDEKKKLKVMVKIFGRKTPLELGYVQVEKNKE